MTFRARKEETDKAREKRLRSLEAMVDRIGNAFFELADYIIGSEVYKEDLGILGKLAATTTQVLVLSRESNDHEPMGGPSSPERDSLLEPHQDLHFSAQVCVGQLTASPAETDPGLHPDTISSNQYPSDKDIAAEHDGASTIQNPFGNGWFARLPRLLGGHQSSNDPSSLDRTSFAFRLLISTLENAYWALVGATEESTTLSDRMFRFALLYHDKHELQFNLRWFLGPGIGESYLLMERNRVDKPSIAKANGDLLNPGVDLAAVEDSQRNFGYGFLGSQAAYELFSTVKDVDEYLKERGARHIDSEIIELAFAYPGSLTTTPDASIAQVSSTYVRHTHSSAPFQEFHDSVTSR
ncbi:uncharacterized protein B0I36DRAFT_125800 [Microdochium trichocladiopsis]|uniref:Uncharacterized protein n=1 Tax=Microdochium trichocladiopsis TaxID=1682393 RepID=A0A9P8YA14_9PEZI|nr:uncharacterized protein B0I36DRAFT_125800 [Microdochium trichocladiopsis]KAH7031701.1 hypothetical protein B0I36DRAFT_125800 [Microdochium trichocladiopsis]